MLPSTTNTTSTTPLLLLLSWVAFTVNELQSGRVHSSDESIFPSHLHMLSFTPGHQSSVAVIHNRLFCIVTLCDFVCLVSFGLIRHHSIKARMSVFYYDFHILHTFCFSLTPPLSLFLFRRCSILVSVWYRAHKEREARCGPVSGLSQGHHTHQDAGDECEWGMW